ncbi:NADPH-dependent aldehyde reductase Ahr [Arenicella xantha]|uniref:alcohol dehydrogenase (NADP(+)) n=1 Tax=Arenicella xantha TaxID=644221 RepID=A0A395JNH9_9GAMM|nr:NAD(P)-dependent alcohol dehydrogenase [Arenicella xantha]RBP51347.1 putative zinc-type alcohol dehydrogenase-like protein [Arenicella xantha]
MINAYAAREPKGELTPFEYDPGDLNAHDVEIDVEYCGICHSDLSVLDSEWGRTNYPMVPGHEVVGKIAAIGDQVNGLAIGDRVGLGWHAGSCDHCDMCDTGDHNLCSQSQPTIMGRHGGFADRVRAAGNSVIKLPEGMDAQSAGPLFCGGITVFNPLVQFDVKPTDRVAVIGIGGLGHMALQFLNAWGCDVTAFTSSEDKRDELLSMGAHHVLNSRDAEQLKQASGSFDMIISTVNVKLDWNSYLGTLAPRGRLHFVGAALDPLDIGVFNMMGKQLSVSASTIGSPATIKQMLEFANLHNIKPIIETYKFDDVNAAVERLRSGKARYRVVLER